MLTTILNTSTYIYTYKNLTSLYIHLITFASMVNTTHSHIWYMSLVLKSIRRYTHTYTSFLSLSMLI